MDRRRFLKRGSLLAGLASIASVFNLAPFSTAQAAVHSSQGGSTAAVLNEAEATSYIQKVKASPDYQRFFQKIKSQYSGTFIIDEASAHAYSVTDQRQTWIAVSIPVIGGAGHSSYWAAFQGGNSIVESRDHLYMVDGSNTRGVVERNGKLLLDAVTTPTGSFVHGTAYKPDGTTVSLGGLTVSSAVARINSNNSVTPDACIFFWPCLAGCFGVSGAIIGIATFACFAVCIGVSQGNPIVFAQCRLCLVAALGVSSEAALFCVNVCAC